MTEKINELKTAFESHKAELGSFGAGFLVGSLFVYTTIHKQVAGFFRSVRKFVNE